MKRVKYLAAVCFLSFTLAACHWGNGNGPANSAPDNATQSEKADAQTAATEADDSNYVDPNSPAVVTVDSEKMAKEKAKRK